MKRTLFISDLDGTLLGPDSKVSAGSAEIISRLSGRGALITVATARTPATVEPLLSETLTLPPAIVMTGAALWDRQTQSYLHPVYVPGGELPTLMALFNKSEIAPFVYHLPASGGIMTVAHSPDMTEYERRFYEDRKDMELKRFEFDYSIEGENLRHDDVILLYAMGAADRIEALAELLRGNDALSVSCYRDIFSPHIANIEIFGAGVSKAAAVRRVAEMTGAERVIAYGDNLNDLPMFSVASESVAVANALPEVKAAASRVIGANYDDSVALDIEKIVSGHV